MGKRISLGLTGIWGSGKSTVLEMFRALGAETLSADHLVHRLLEEPGVVSQIKEVFGAEYVRDGVVQRSLLAGVVFSDPEAKERLEGIIHPRVFDEIRRFLQSEDGWLRVVEVPLLFETSSEGMFDYTVVVKAGRQNVIRRLLERGYSQEEIISRLNNQMSEDEKVRRADFVIDNSGEIEVTRDQVKRIYEDLMRLYEEGDC